MYFMWAMPWDGLFTPYVRGGSADRPVHLHSLVCALIVRYIDSTMHIRTIVNSQFRDSCNWICWFEPYPFAYLKRIISFRGSYVYIWHFHEYMHKNCYIIYVAMLQLLMYLLFSYTTCKWSESEFQNKSSVLFCSLKLSKICLKMIKAMTPKQPIRTFGFSMHGYNSNFTCVVWSAPKLFAF